MINVLLLFGGDSEEHMVSCKSAKNILENIDHKKFNVTSVGIKGNWYIFNDNLEYLENGNWLDSNVTKIDNIIEFIKSFDVVFPIIHGNTCEDGKIQGMLEMFNIKYVGCDSSSNLISYDKDLTKIILNSYNIKQVNHITIDKNYNIKNIIKKLKFPLIIKPSRCGSSIGITKANNKNELKKAINVALKHDNKVVVEEFVNARELECAILENNGLKVSDIGEIITNCEFYDYNAKYNDSDSKTIVSADIPDNIKKQIKEIAIKVFKSLNCKTMARVDFLYNGNIYLNEINTIPGFTCISMYPMLLTNEKFTYKDLITALIKSAL
ncbi:MAG: D-alanine--D-alanine ligase [Clostridium sp.]|nr:D-alanine--D-alanine ligase [Clostridium sp.]MCM1443928.1 D-alanine--D-alanine ligase [Candidatus Amulumruptor caecigallinarius]